MYVRHKQCRQDREKVWRTRIRSHGKEWKGACLFDFQLVSLFCYESCDMTSMLWEDCNEQDTLVKSVPNEIQATIFNLPISKSFHSPSCHTSRYSYIRFYYLVEKFLRTFVSHPNFLLDRIDELTPLYHLLPCQRLLTPRSGVTGHSRRHACGTTPLRSSHNIQAKLSWVLFAQSLRTLIRIRDRPVFESPPSGNGRVSRISKSSNAATQPSRKVLLSGAIISAGGDVFVHEIGNIGKMANASLRNAHVLEYRSEYRLIHLVQADVQDAANACVLPGEVNHWTCEPEIAVYLRCAVVMRCRVLVADERGEIGEWVEG